VKQRELSVYKLWQKCSSCVV